MIDNLHASNMQYFQLFMKGRLADAWNRRMDVCFQSLHKPNGHISFYLEFQLEDKTISFEISYFAPCLYIWNLSSQIQMESKMYYLADGRHIITVGDLWQGRMSSGQRGEFTREDEFTEFYIYRCHRFTFSWAKFRKKFNKEKHGHEYECNHSQILILKRRNVHYYFRNTWIYSLKKKLTTKILATVWR